MKKLLIFLSFTLLNSSEIPYNYNPFYEASSQKYSQTKSKALSLHVEAVLNDKVLINKKWYKIGEHIGKYKLISADYKSVMLQVDGRRIFLPTSQEKTINELTIKDAK